MNNVLLMCVFFLSLSLKNQLKLLWKRAKWMKLNFHFKNRQIQNIWWPNVLWLLRKITMDINRVQTAKADTFHWSSRQLKRLFFRTWWRRRRNKLRQFWLKLCWNWMRKVEKIFIAYFLHFFETICFSIRKRAFKFVFVAFN